MWFLDNAWLIPVIPTVSFFLIILFGKRTARWTNGGSESVEEFRVQLSYSSPGSGPGVRG